MTSSAFWWGQLYHLPSETNTCGFYELPTTKQTKEKPRHRSALLLCCASRVFRIASEDEHCLSYICKDRLIRTNLLKRQLIRFLSWEKMAPRGSSPSIEVLIPWNFYKSMDEREREGGKGGERERRRMYWIFTICWIVDVTARDCIASVWSPMWFTHNLDDGCLYFEVNSAHI